MQKKITKGKRKGKKKKKAWGTRKVPRLEVVKVDNGNDGVESLLYVAFQLVMQVEGNKLFFCWKESVTYWSVLLHNPPKSCLKWGPDQKGIICCACACELLLDVAMLMILNCNTIKRKSRRK